MKKLNKVASLFATAALAFSAVGVSAQTVDNWVSGTGLPWKNGTNELCWRKRESSGCKERRHLVQFLHDSPLEGRQVMFCLNVRFESETTGPAPCERAPTTDRVIVP